MASFSIRLTLGNYLQIKFDEDPEAQQKLAEVLEVAPETVLAWWMGTQRPDDVQCLMIADFFDEDRRAVLLMAREALVTVQ